MSEKTKPVEQIRIGAICAAIWQNETENGPRFNVTIERLYRKGNDWRSTNSLRRDDLLQAAKVLNLAHSAIYELQSCDETGEPAV